ncbi:MAG TPA: M48 family metalloprotease [Bryobacteraceae bacterium]|nr:M48 family metalloprotease [Bryobacteraceae bacterium]
MKHWPLFAVIVLLLTAALIWSEVTKPEAHVGPESILNLIADSQRELMRLPVAFAPLPDAEEIDIGRQLEQSYGNLFELTSDEDRAIEAYVQKVGAFEAAHAYRKLPYRFHYVPSLNFVNAFALPGGVVSIGGGLLSMLETEDELAGVLGHEIEHIDRYHCAERIQIEAALHRMPAGELVALPVEVFFAGYSKSQELEADREGVKLAVISGYSPQGAIQLFETFERFKPERRVRAGSPQEELSTIALQGLLGYFRSHPSNTERIDQIRKMIADGQLPDRPTKRIEFKPAALSKRVELNR